MKAEWLEQLETPCIVIDMVSLYFDIDLPAAVIHRQDIQPYRASLQVLNGMLCLC